MKKNIKLDKIKICLASNNKHKIEELKKILSEGFEVFSMNEIGCNDEIEETGTTFHENAEIKAKYIYQKYKVNIISDDSGLEVEALNNQPGVYSARYAGEPSNSENNIDKLLSELQTQQNRKAAFKTVICLIFNGENYFFEGSIRGEIIKERRGEGGFGYDPVFIPDGYDKTFAELSAETKNKISHRAIATQKLIAFLIHKQD